MAAENNYKELDQERVKAAVKEFLLAIGEDPEREGLLDTPDRVALAWSSLVVCKKILQLTCVNNSMKRAIKRWLLSATFLSHLPASITFCHSWARRTFATFHKMVALPAFPRLLAASADILAVCRYKSV